MSKCRDKPEDADSEIGEFTDVSSHGMRDALAELRAQGGRQKEVQQLKRDHAGEINNAYADIAGGWEEGSAGRRLRYRFAHLNPYLELDVKKARTILGLEREDISSPEFAAWLDFVRTGSAKKKKTATKVFKFNLSPIGESELEHHAIGFWLHVHDLALKGRKDELLDNLPKKFAESARDAAAIELEHVADRPDWLVGVSQSESQSALHLIAGALVERYGLPKRMSIRLLAYILTGNPEPVRIEENPDVEVTVHPNGHPVASTIDIRITGIDSFWTGEDWDEIWERIVRDHVEESREARANLGFAVEAPSLARMHRVLPAIRMSVRSGDDPSDMDISALIRGMPYTGMSERTLYRDVADLIKVLRPVDREP